MPNPCPMRPNQVKNPLCLESSWSKYYRKGVQIQRKENGPVGPAPLITAPSFLISILGNSKLRPLRAAPETPTSASSIFVPGGQFFSTLADASKQSYLYCVFENCVKIFAIPMVPSLIFTTTTVSLLSYQWVIEREGKQMNALSLPYSKTVFWNVWSCPFTH